jgi:transposase InsO family protein
MEERARFVFELEQDESTMAELCRRYGITRPTGYKWWERYQHGGVKGLEEVGRAPRHHRNAMSAELEEAVLDVRRAHSCWGPRKVRAWLAREQPEQRWPAASTMGALLKREGLTVARKARRKAPPQTQPFHSAEANNVVWCADFKGWFRTGDGERCDPLTISDACSRYLLRCQAVGATDTRHVQPVFEAAFCEYGMPQAIRSDNGAPFASRALGGLSKLSIWWIKLGIVPERIAPGHPEQNGRHERLHRTLKAETASPPETDRRAQQRRFDRFLEEYNCERPHEAIGLRTPASVYVPSPRLYTGRLPEIEYAIGVVVRKVQQHGQIYWKHQAVFLSEVLAGEQVGLGALDERYYMVYFGPVELGVLDTWKLRVRPINGRWAEARPEDRAAAGGQG